ncbi:uncharacterized protein LOC144170689 [Haemaphysalis longicornis]
MKSEGTRPQWSGVNLNHTYKSRCLSRPSGNLSLLRCAGIRCTIEAPCSAASVFPSSGATAAMLPTLAAAEQGDGEQRLRRATKSFSLVFFVWVLLSTTLVILVVPAGLLGVYLFRRST